MYKGRETRGSSYREAVGWGEQNGLGIYEGNCLFENKLYVIMTIKQVFERITKDLHLLHMK